MKRRIKPAWAAARKAPLASKIVLVAVILYLVNPIDLIPDFIPVLGQLDDLLIIGLALGYLAKHSPDVVAALKGEEP